MQKVSQILRQRRRRRKPNLSIGARVGVMLLILIPISLGSLSVAVSRLYLELTQQVPAVEDMTAFFDEDGLRPSTLVDRNGELLVALTNPAAREHRWVGVSQPSPVVAPELLLTALIAEQDPTFWDNPGYSPTQTMTAMLADLVSRGGNERSLTITEQLIAATLMPIENNPAGSLRRDFRIALLSERLTSRYEKQQILEWYLNTIDFGHYVYGVDGASLAFFGKHVNGLTLAEIAVLAGLPGQAEEVLASPAAIRQMQREVLERMTASGEISARQAREARAQPLQLNNLKEVRSFPEQRAYQFAIDQTRAGFGADITSRGGLTIVTSLDGELQEQAYCLLKTQLARLSGDSANVTVPTADGSPCLASGLLPAVRPGDAGVDRAVDGGALIVTDPVSGKIRAYAGVKDDTAGGSPLRAHSAGELIHPFIYITAFSRGFAPGSMVLDLPSRGTLQEEGLSNQMLADYEGPVRMRQALQSGLRGAAAQTIELAGLESVKRTLLEFGLFPEGQTPTRLDFVRGSIPVEPLVAAHAFTALANDGVAVGIGNGTLMLIAVDRIEDRFGRPHELNGRTSRAILSEALAFLINDVLRGSRAFDRGGRSLDLLTVGRPAAWYSAHEPDEQGIWSVAYAPNTVVLAWYGNTSGFTPEGLTPANSTLSVAEAMLRYSTRDLPAEDWARPPEVSEVEVCDPSGLLPTSYCPEVVTEIYLQGTEPTSFDNLYEPFRINRETGNLATLATPLDLIDEKVFMVPPPEASDWAEAVDLAQPPAEYDPLPAQVSNDQEVNITTPESFQIIRGDVQVRGNVHPEGFEFFRLQAGAGLNPTRWIQIGEDKNRQVRNGRLGLWDTEALSGLYTLQLVAVLDDGEIRTASVPVTIDNLAPRVSILQPRTELEYTSSDRIVVEVAIEEGLALQAVIIALDGRTIDRVTEPPYGTVLANLEPGKYELSVEATDIAGNTSEKALREIVVIP